MTSEKIIELLKELRATRQRSIAFDRVEDWQKVTGIAAALRDNHEAWMWILASELEALQRASGVAVKVLGEKQP